MGYFRLYLTGDGIDIGCGQDILNVVVGKVIPYDKIHVDTANEAETMSEIGEKTFDFAYSSNCLEHIDDPVSAMRSWIRIVKTNGFIFITVPDEGLYEHNKWPSQFNKDHKWSFTLKESSKLPKSIYLPEWLKQFGVEIVLIRMVDTNYDYTLIGVDQTNDPYNAEACIEIILRRKV